MKKILALVLAALMLSAMMVPAFAAGDGSIVINNAVSGHTYTAYQIFSGKWNASVSKLGDIQWGTGISAEGQTALYNAYSLTGTNQTAAKVAEAIGTDDAAAQAFANHIGEGDNLGSGTTGTFDDTDPDNPTYTISSLDDGYYMIVDTYTPSDGETDVYYARYMIQKVGTVSINNKADKPSVEKDIWEDDGDNTVEDGELTDANTANIGDEVTYRITSRVPDMTGYKEYYMDFTDTLSKGLTYKPDSLQVKIAGNPLTVGTAYTFDPGTYNESTGTTLIVHLKDLVSRNYAKDAVIEIIYKATVNDNAVIGVVGNPNTVTLEYSNNPRNSGDGQPDSGDDGVHGITPPSEVKTFVVGIRLTKVNPSAEKLEGAVFNITATEINKVLITGEEFVVDASGTYYKLANDKGYTEKAPNAQIASQYAELQGSEADGYSGTPKYVKQAYATSSVQKTANTTFQVTSDTNGIIELKGLHEGTYVFTEIQAPDGYNLLTSPITVVITSNIATISDPANFAWSATKKVGTGAAETLTLTQVGTSGVYEFQFEVENRSGSTLPTTGGIGTTLFYVGGGILILLAVVLLVTKRRMSGND